MSHRQIDGTVLTLSASGWTYLTRFVLYDYETGSLWFPLEGRTTLTCVQGQFADRTLEPAESSRTSWIAWKAAHPETKVMAP